MEHLKERVSLGTEAKRAVGLPEVVVLEDLLSFLRRPVHRRSLQVVLRVNLHRRRSINAAIVFSPGNTSEDNGSNDRKKKSTAVFMRRAEGRCCGSVEAAQRCEEAQVQRVCSLEGATYWAITSIAKNSSLVRDQSNPDVQYILPSIGQMGGRGAPMQT